jgi:hypothetical protein
MRFKIGWDTGMYRVSIPDYGGGEVVTADEHDLLVRAHDAVVDKNIHLQERVTALHSEREALRAQLEAKLYSCPECCFTFDASHTNEDGGGYSCPVCAELKLTALVERLEGALQRVRDMEPEPYAFPTDWHEQIQSCAECERWKDHPIQRGICDEHRRPLYAREQHDASERAALGYRMQRIASEALNAYQREQVAAPAKG